ncbi:hypothetical protein [Methanosphaera sp.]
MNNYNEAMNKINSADAILISASNGLSIAEGYNIFADNNDFKKYFGYFREKYGIYNIIQGVYAQLPQDEHDQFMDFVVNYLITSYNGSEVFNDLKKIVEAKDYFIITSNADKHFQINHFDENKLFEIEGTFLDLHEDTPERRQQYKNYNDFLSKYHGKNVVILELGIGKYNQLIKEPLMTLVYNEKNFSYITLNLEQEIYIPQQIMDKSIPLCGDIGQSFKEILKYK